MKLKLAEEEFCREEDPYDTSTFIPFLAAYLWYAYVMLTVVKVGLFGGLLFLALPLILLIFSFLVKASETVKDSIMLSAAVLALVGICSSPIAEMQRSPGHHVGALIAEYFEVQVQKKGHELEITEPIAVSSYNWTENSGTVRLQNYDPLKKNVFYTFTITEDKSQEKNSFTFFRTSKFFLDDIQQISEEENHAPLW